VPETSEHSAHPELGSHHLELRSCLVRLMRCAGKAISRSAVYRRAPEPIDKKRSHEDGKRTLEEVAAAAAPFASYAREHRVSGWNRSRLDSVRPRAI
jgi:hypothetical protein